MKIKIGGRDFTIGLHCRTWELAARVMVRNREFPPKGYKLYSSFITNRNESGNRASLDMRFRHVDHWIEPMTSDEARSLFDADRRTANGD